MFKVGDKVICVNAGLGRLIKNGETYKVLKTFKSNGDDFVTVEIEDPYFENDYFANRFELVNTKKKIG